MNIDKIRKMNDEELECYLKHLTNRSVNECSRCSKPSSKTVKIENKSTFQTKQLCGLCEDCYDELIDWLGTSDLNWRD